MAVYQFYSMTVEHAQVIVHWRYQELYSMYNMDTSDESISELLSGEYYYALDQQNGVAGFICSGNSARVPGGFKVGIYDNSTYLDIGLGLRPDMTGKGMGEEFLSHAIHFLREKYKVQHFQLVVALFNQRAIKVYERAGFVKGVRFQSVIGDQAVDFIVMNLSLRLFSV